MQGRIKVDAVEQNVLHKTNPVEEALHYCVIAMVKALQINLENLQLISIKERDLESWPMMLKRNVDWGFFL